MLSTSPQQSKLLVVDDNAINLELLVSSLGHYYDLRTAISGQTALNLLAEGFLPELILLDIMMPGMDGYKVCQRLQSDQETQHIPIIFLTSLDSEEDEAKGLALGAVDYITKPFSPAIVRRRVQTHLELKQSRDHLQELVAEKIEELKYAQHKEQEKEAFLKSVLLAAPVAIGFIVDRKMVWVNQRTTEMTGYSSVELEGQQTSMLYPSAEVDKQVAEVYPQIQKTGYGSFETVWRTKTGGDIDIFVNAAALDKTNLSAGVIFAVSDVTQRKQAEAALQLNEDRLKQAQQVAQVGSWEYNLKDSTLHWSDEVYRIFGVDKKQFKATYENFFLCIHPEDRELVSTAYLDSINNKSPYDVVHRLLLEDGTIKYVQEKCETEFDADGLPLVSFGTVQDITKLRQAEESMRLSEDKYSRFFKLSPDAITLSRMSDGSFLEVNQVFTKLSGWSVQEVLGRSSIDLNLWCSSKDRERMTSALCKYGEVIDLEVPLQHKDGHITCCLISARQIKIGDEDCLLSITRDITEQKRNEKEIVKAKEEWETTFDAMSDMITIHDLDMRVVRANKAANDFFGVADGSLIGKVCCDAFWSSSESCSGCPLLRTLSDMKPHSEIFSYNIPDKNFLVTTTPIYPQTGTPEFFIHIAKDITEQKQLEEEASRANRLAALGELAAGVAHEINNPNAMNLYNSEILGAIFKDILPWMKANPPENTGRLFGGLTYRDALQEIPVLLPAIYDSAQRIKRIVDELRDFTRQDTSDRQETVVLNQVVQSSVRLVINTINRATDVFILELGKDLPMISGIKGRLEQVIINLLLNACQALENRSQKISVTTVYDIDAAQLQLVIADEGVGMSVETMEHIFEPFVTTKREHGGTGLGLSVSARIVKEHLGQLTFTSSLGQGTTAIMELPVLHKESHVN